MVPAPLESVIASSPLVSGAVVFGRGRSQVGVLIEPSIDISDVSMFRNHIWHVPFLFYVFNVLTSITF